MTRTYQLVWSVTVALIASIALPLLTVAQELNPDNEPPLPGMSDAALWAIITGAAVPWITATINRVQWQPLVKWAVFFTVALIMSAVTTLINGGLDTTNYLHTMLFVVATATLTYLGWKRAITAVEEKTN